jgi:hypothetical protein
MHYRLGHGNCDPEEGFWKRELIGRLAWRDLKITKQNGLS